MGQILGLATDASAPLPASASASAPLVPSSSAPPLTSSLRSGSSSDLAAVSAAFSSSSTHAAPPPPTAHVRRTHIAIPRLPPDLAILEHPPHFYDRMAELNYPVYQTLRMTREECESIMREHEHHGHRELSDIHSGRHHPAFSSHSMHESYYWPPSRSTPPFAHPSRYSPPPPPLFASRPPSSPHPPDMERSFAPPPAPPPAPAPALLSTTPRPESKHSALDDPPSESVAMAHPRSEEARRGHGHGDADGSFECIDQCLRETWFQVERLQRIQKMRDESLGAPSSGMMTTGLNQGLIGLLSKDWDQQSHRVTCCMSDTENAIRRFLDTIETQRRWQEFGRASDSVGEHVLQSWKVNEKMVDRQIEMVNREWNRLCDAVHYRSAFLSGVIVGSGGGGGGGDGGGGDGVSVGGDGKGR